MCDRENHVDHRFVTSTCIHFSTPGGNSSEFASVFFSIPLYWVYLSDFVSKAGAEQTGGDLISS